MSRPSKKITPSEPKALVIQKRLEYVVVPKESALKIVRDMLGADKAIIFSKDAIPKELFLTRSGELYRGDNRAQFSFMFENRRAALIRAFLGNGNDFIPGVDLQEEAGYKTKESMYKAIDAINMNVRRQLGIQEKELIESRGAKGFRITPAYKIIRAKE